METLRIKHRDFQIIEKVSDNVFKCSYKNKVYLVTHFEPHTSSADELIYNLERIFSSGVSSPKLRFIDKKSGYYVRDLVEGKKVIEYLGETDITEDQLQQLFNNAFLAKIKGITLDYSPDKWIIADERLIYIDTYCTKYDENSDLVKSYLRLWFPTTEMEKYLQKYGISIDKNRIKDQYSVNKQIVLMLCKYYK